MFSRVETSWGPRRRYHVPKLAIKEGVPDWRWWRGDSNTVLGDEVRIVFRPETQREDNAMFRRWEFALNWKLGVSVMPRTENRLCTNRCRLSRSQKDDEANNHESGSCTLSWPPTWQFRGSVRGSGWQLGTREARLVLKDCQKVLRARGGDGCWEERGVSKLGSQR